MITKRNFAVGGGLRMITRMRVDAATAAQGGMVAAPFLFDVQREMPPGTLVRDEIDHELITNNSRHPPPHNTFTNVWNDGNFASGGAGQTITNPAGFSIAAFHDYRTDWTASSVKYYIDDVLVRTETSVVPDDPMQAHWNLLGARQHLRRGLQRRLDSQRQARARPIASKSTACRSSGSTRPSAATC